MVTRCPICGTNHAQCGPRVTASHRPVDLLEEVPAMRSDELRHYFVTQPNGRDAVLKLNEADAERMGGRLVAPDAPAAPPAAKSRRARNKARTAKDKGATPADG